MPAPFRVSYSAAMLAEVKRLFIRAREVGLDKEFLAALAKVHDALEQQPLDFGDPAFGLHFAKIRIRHEIVRPILVYWGVHEESSTVYLKSIELWPGLPEAS